jgi:hypothetical protein
MQEKVAVGEAVKAAYGFAFGRTGAVFGVIWAPSLLSIALTAAITLIAADLMGVGTDGSGGLSFVLLPAASLIEAVFGGVMTAGVTMVALGRRRSPAGDRSFARAVLRMIAANVIVMIIAFMLMAVLFAVLIAAAYGLGVPLPGPMSPGEWILFPLRHLSMCGFMPGTCSPLLIIAMVVLLFAGFAVLIYVMVRLTFFLPAVVVVEKRVGLRRAWTLARGNFWRMFAVWVAVILPVLIAFAAVEQFTLKYLSELYGAPAGSLSETGVALLAASGMPAFLIVRSLIRLVSDAVTTGLECGAAVRAYMQITLADAAEVF